MWCGPLSLMRDGTQATYDMPAIDEWLINIGMEQYSSVFADHKIDSDGFLELGDGDLRELKIPLGDRKRLLKAIRQFREGRGIPGSQAGSEYRFLSIIFVDVVGSTSLAQRLEPEDLAYVMNAFHELGSTVVERFGGYVARDLGDGFAAYFGWPESQEQGAERAVLAGLDLIKAVKSISTKTAPLQLHIAVATGEVVISDVVRSRSERVREAFGPLPNLAARLQAISPPDTILLSDKTHELIRHKFHCLDFGRKKLKGFREPMPVSQVVGQRPLTLLFDARKAIGLTPFVGREAEVALLRERWRQTVAGNGQSVLISGEPGIGKSRLCSELRSSIGGESFYCLSFQCSPFHTNNPFFPIAQSLAKFAQFSDADQPQEQRRKLESLFKIVGDDTKSGISLLARQFGIAGPESEQLTLVAAERQRRTMHKLLSDFILNLSYHSPVLVIFEDIHWSDPTTSEFIELLAGEAPKGAVLLLATHRPSPVPAWHSKAHSTIALSPLSRSQSAEIVAASADLHDLPSVVVSEIIERSDGNPLFIEELTAATAGRKQTSKLANASSARQYDIPSTLHESLLARIDQVSSGAKELIQLCAVVGRRFSYAQVSVVGDALIRNLDQALAELVEQRLLDISGRPPAAEYSFRHALIQEAAYAIIVRDKRRRFHAICAEALEKHFPAVCKTDPGALGSHHEIAGNTVSAINYFLEAGQIAIERSALKEAGSALERGLSLLQPLRHGEWKDRQEFNLRSMLGRVHIFAEGWADPSVKAEYGRALELSEALGLEAEQVPVEWALATYHLLRGEIREAIAGGLHVLELAEQKNDNDLLHAAHSALAIYQFYGGHFVGALHHADGALRSYRPEASETLRKQFGTDRRLQALRGAALCHWCMGNHAKALELDKEQRLLAKSGGRQYEYTYALTISCILHALRRDGLQTQSFALEAIDIAQTQGFKFLEANARNFHAIGAALRQPHPDALDECDRVIEAYQAAGNRMGTSSMFAILADLCAALGLHERGLRYIDKALIYARRSGEHFVQSELYLIKGALVAATGNIAEESRWLNKALSLARKQQAKTWEREAAVRLADLARRQSELARAYDQLEPWCREHQDTSRRCRHLSETGSICTECLAAEPTAANVEGEETGLFGARTIPIQQR
jgi:predicted ATPase/class 3 adenylate cyclase